MIVKVELIVYDRNVNPHRIGPIEVDVDEPEIDEDDGDWVAQVELAAADYLKPDLECRIIHEKTADAPEE